LPTCFVVKNGSKILDCVSASMPQPVSVTVSRTKGRDSSSSVTLDVSRRMVPPPLEERQGLEVEHPGRERVALEELAVALLRRLRRQASSVRHGTYLRTMPLLERPDTRIAYETAGAGPPVLFIQGVGVPGGGWRPQLDGLAERFQCASFDNRGIGRSAPVVGGVSIADMVGDAVALMDHLGWTDAHIVGHSMGGIIAHQLALEARERVRSLSLLCTFLSGKDAARLTAPVAWLGLRTRVGTRRMRRQAFLEMVLPPAARSGADLDALAAYFGGFFGRDLADQPPIVMKQVRAMARHDDSARLAELSGIPTLVSSCAWDVVALPEYGRALAARIGGRYQEFADAAHGVTIAQPAAVNALLAEHFTAVETSRR
jgi:pimeloyl-ACP methyl ester carboxylesterase